MHFSLGIILLALASPAFGQTSPGLETPPRESTPKTYKRVIKYFRQSDKDEDHRCRKLMRMCWHPDLKMCVECERRMRQIADKIEKSVEPNADTPGVDLDILEGPPSTSGTLAP